METNPSEWKIAVDGTEGTTALVYESRGLPVGASLILAHGAGASQRSPFIVALARELAAAGLDVVTFNFLYMEQGRKVPDRRPMLEACYLAVIEAAVRQLPQTQGRIFIGGRSMGGRIATHVCAANPGLPVLGLVLLGYPLHPPGRPAQRRDAHLPDVRRPTLIVQGSRDAFGGPDEFESVLRAMQPTPTLHVIDGGDHSFKVARAGATGQGIVIEGVQRAVTEWIERVIANTSPPRPTPDPTAPRADEPR